MRVPTPPLAVSRSALVPSRPLLELSATAPHGHTRAPRILLPAAATASWGFSAAGMRKKGRAAVPEWLNSPMWSAPDPPPAPPDPYGADLAPPPPPPPLKPATPAVPPPPSYAEAVGERGGRRRRGQGVRKEEDEDGGLAESVIRAHLLADFKAAVGFSSRSVG
jgi:hypothetical protein